MSSSGINKSHHQRSWGHQEIVTGRKGSSWSHHGVTDCNATRPMRDRFSITVGIHNIRMKMWQQDTAATESQSMMIQVEINDHLWLINKCLNHDYMTSSFQRRSSTSTNFSWLENVYDLFVLSSKHLFFKLALCVTDFCTYAQCFISLTTF